MAYAVELTLDYNSSQFIQSVWDDFAVKQIAEYAQQAGIHPHITLAIYEHVDCITCEEQLNSITQNVSQFEFTFTHLGLFMQQEIVLFIAPTVTKEMIDLHNEVVGNLEKHTRGAWDYYLPGNWTPHCTLAYNILPEKLPFALSVAANIKLPFRAHATSICVTEFQPVKTVFKISLKPPKI